METSDLIIKGVNKYEVTDSAYIPLTFNLRDWKIIDDNIVFFSQGTNHFCTVYNYADADICYNMAGRGKGNEEYITCNWCKIKRKKEISLYDIMNKKLNIYSVSNKGYKVEETYHLPTDKSGLAFPYTQIVHYKESLFLLKEDGDETNLRLVDLNCGEEFASYHCSYRDGKEEPYTPYDYLFHVIDNVIVISYRFFDRIEILKIDGNQILPIVCYGENNDVSLSKNYDSLQYHCIFIETKDRNFYILKSSKGEDEGQEILVLNADNYEISLINLPKPIKAFTFDNNGVLTGYKESDSGIIMYKFQ